MKDVPLSDLLRQSSINIENQFMAFSDSSWKYCLDTGRSIRAYNIFYQCVPIEHGTHFTGPVDQSSAERDYNVACSEGIALAPFRMLIRELLNKDPDIVTQEVPLTLLGSKPSVCMDNNGKYIKHKRHISRRVHFVRNGEKCKIHKIDQCEVGLQLTDIVTKNFSENDLNTRMKYIMVRLYNRYITLVQQG